MVSTCHRHLFSLLALVTVTTIISTRYSPPLVLARAEDDRARFVQSLITGAAFRALREHPRTGLLYNVTLPSGLAGVDSTAVRYRSGSLRRHGGRVEEFRLPRGVVVRPFVERLVAVRSNLGNLSIAYERYCSAAGYRLVSSVLSLLVYDAAGLLNSPTNRTAPQELDIAATGQAITVDLSASVRTLHGGGDGIRCAMFEWDGKLKILDPVSSRLCTTRRQGRFAMVTLASSPTSRRDKVGGGGACRWKVALAGALGGLLGAALLGLLCVAFVKGRKRREVAEMERRAYEEEVLQVSMIGHVRAPTAAAARSVPEVEDEYVPHI